MADVILYGFAPSTYTRTARMACAESGASHELRPLEFKQPSHFALHPFGKMPVMQLGGVTLFESLAIASYVDDVFGGGRLQPKQPANRARMLQWISASIDYVYRNVVGALIKSEATDGAALETARAQLRVADAALAQSAYLAGEKVSLADLFLFPMLDYAAANAGEPLLMGFTHLSRWHHEMARRPSAQETRS